MNAARQAIQILKRNGIRTTDNRIALLQFLISHPKAYTLTELEGRFPMDRVTIYRSLNTFADSNIILKIDNQYGTSMYAYHQTHNLHQQVHPHLHCRQCGTLVCLPCLPDDYIHRLEQYEIEEMPLLMEGLCAHCRKNL